MREKGLMTPHLPQTKIVFFILYVLSIPFRVIEKSLLLKIPYNLLLKMRVVSNNYELVFTKFSDVSLLPS